MLTKAGLRDVCSFDSQFARFGHPRDGYGVWVVITSVNGNNQLHVEKMLCN